MSGPGGILVRGNSVVGLRTAPIDALGQASYTYPIAASGRLTVTHFFTRDGSGVAHLEGRVDVKATAPIADGGFHCYVGFTGTRG